MAGWRGGHLQVRAPTRLQVNLMASNAPRLAETNFTDTVEILLIDDDEPWARTTARLLESSVDAFAVEMAYSLQEAHERMRTADSLPDCIVCDYQLGDGTGLALLETVRESSPDLPFILVTGRGNESVASDAISHDVTDYIPKDHDDDQAHLLATRIQQAVQSYRTERALARERRGKNAVLDLLTATTAQSNLLDRFCHLLVREEGYECAWIGTTSDDDHPHPQAGAGCDEYLSEVITDETTTTEIDEPAITALQRDELVVTPAVRDAPTESEAEWRHLADQFGFASAAGVPIRYDGIQFGVIGVYDSNATIDECQKQLLEEYGELLGYAHQTAEWKRSLLSDRSVTVEVEISDDTAPLVGLADRAPAGTSITVPSIIDRDDETTVYLANIEGVTGDILDDIVSQCDSLNIVDTTTDGTVVQCHLVAQGPTPESLITTQEGDFERTKVDDQGAVVTAHIPESSTIRTLTAPLETTYGDITVSTIWGGDDYARRGDETDPDPLALLTDRQLEVLRYAYYDGYFKRPRGSSATELAETFDIARATLTQHLRTAQRKILTQLIDR